MDGVLNSPLHVLDGAAGVALIPAPVEVLGNRAELDDQIFREILWLDLAALFQPEPNQLILIVAHNDFGVRAADESAAIFFVFVQLLGFMLSSKKGSRSRGISSKSHDI
jgi:hypothetical protein